MQDGNYKYLQLAKAIGNCIKNYRENTLNKSLTKLADEYDLNSGTLCKIENGNCACKIRTLWEIANALGMKCSELIALVEEQLGEDFTLIDE